MIGRSRLLSAAAAVGGLAVALPAYACPPAAKPPAPRHVFVINLENKGYATTFGPGSKAPYLSRTLRAQGVLLEQYHGTAHNSLPNYLAPIPSSRATARSTPRSCGRARSRTSRPQDAAVSTRRRSRRCPGSSPPRG